VSKLKQLSKNNSKPKSAIGRWVNSFILMLVFLGSFVAFYIIRFHLCGGFDCRELDITGIWYRFSPVLILFGTSVLIVSIYVNKEINMSSNLSDAITVSIAIAALLLLFIPVGISIEIASIVDRN
jgi:hypothetical protein